MPTVSPPGYLWRELLLDVGSQGKGSHVRSRAPACRQVPDVKGGFQKAVCVQGVGFGVRQSGFTAYFATGGLDQLLNLTEPPFLPL